ncbi:MAG: enoyl-CoA hydratase/isomerase family protein [Candidatus Poribacteria bacterium]|nr:enoyl-CoA hydratase/isomerase family protein [Candidatus Poribacteria bacterium]
MTGTDAKILVRQTAGITTIQLNRPEKLNAIDREMLDELDEQTSLLHRDESVRVVVLTGSGERAFCVGADLNQVATFEPADIRRWVIDGNRVFSRLASLPVPVIAAINGYAIGGGLELALACDLRIAAADSSFGVPEITHGWFPGWGGTHRLLHIIGEAKAKEMVFLGERIDAQTAVGLGLVNRIVPTEALMAEVTKTAESLAEKSPVAIKAAKAALTRHPMPENGFEINYEALALSTCFTTPEVKGGLEAFLKRKREG